MATTSSVSEDAVTYGRSEVDPESEFSYFLRYPILYENAASDSDTNGIGALSDTISCNVVRTRNQFPTLQLTYKRGGVHSKDLDNGRIIMTDLGPDLLHQKFRINQVSKSIDSIVVNATHIAGDIAYNTITENIQLPNASATDLFNTIVNKLADPMPAIRFDTDIASLSNVNMQMGSGNAGNLLIDEDQEGDEPTQSLSALYKGEWTFDDYHFYFQQNGGDDTGLVIKYGRDLKTIDQDESIANTYTAIYPYATYTPAPAKATDTNEDWNTIGGNGWISIATATYAAGGRIDIYSSPVTGHRIVGQVTNGTHLNLTRKITDGETLPDKKVVNTVNGDDWYYVENRNGYNGWIDARWLTFDKSGDYVINNAVGHYTVDIGSGSGRQTKYPFRGRGVVHYTGKYIRAYYSPFFGSTSPNSDKNGHVPVNPTGGDKYARVPTGTYVNFDYKAINEKGDAWYRIAGQKHRWLYGKHLSFSAKGTYIEDPTANGRAAIKSGAQKYVMSGGNIVKAPDQKKWESTRTKKTKPYVQKKYYIKYHGKKIAQKHLVKNKAYTHKKKVNVKTTIKKGIYKITGQVQSGGTTYYKTGNNTYVANDGVDWKNRMSYKPKTIDDSIKGRWTEGKIEMYKEPRFGTAINWAIPNGASFSTGATAHGDGEDWTFCTYEGKDGWVLTKYLKNKGDADFDSYNPDDLESSDDTQQTDDSVDVEDLTVKLPELTLYADSAYGQELTRVQAVDLTSYFQHDYQDESGFDQATGKYQVTQKDIDQLRQLAQAYMKEHRFGEPQVSLTLTAEQISDYQLDNIGLYDKVTVSFDELGIEETAEVNSTTWDAMAHRYTSMTIGALPITFEHYLLSTAKQNTDLAVKKSAAIEAGKRGNLTSEIHYALQAEGSDRAAAFDKLADKLKLESQARINDGNEFKTFKEQAVTTKQFTDAMTKYDNQMQATREWIMNGGTDELQFLDNSNQTNFVHPTKIVSYDSSTNSRMVFNSHGLGWFKDGYTSTAIDSRGWINAEYINAGTIQSLSTKELLVNGQFTSNVGGYTMTMGANNPGVDGHYILKYDNDSNQLVNIDSSRGFAVGTGNYGAVLGSGSLIIGRDASLGGGTMALGPTYLHINGSNSNNDANYFSVQTTRTDLAGLDLVLGGNEYIMKQGYMSIKAASGNWHRVLTSGNVGSHAYVTVGGTNYYLKINSNGW